jgi:aminopeptidase N
MSSYLFSVLIGDLKHVEMKSKRGILIRVISVPEVEHLLHKSAKVLRQCFDVIDSMFERKYPMEKLGESLHYSYL